MYTTKPAHIVSVYPVDGNPFRRYFSSKKKAEAFISREETAECAEDLRAKFIYEGCEKVTFNVSPGEFCPIDVD